jgi:PAS domain S-box-containing protein
LDLFGYTREEAIGLDVQRIYINPDDRLRYQQEIEKEGAVKDYELKLRKKDGGEIECLKTATVRKTKDEGILGYHGIIRDITERKRAEEKLRTTQDYLGSLLRYANAPIIVWDTEQRITIFNMAFERLTGRMAGEVIGQPLSVLFPEASRDESQTKIRRTSSGEYWESVEIPVLHKDGKIRIALWNSANIYGKDGKTLLATIAQGQDITERKRMEEKYEHLVQKEKDIIYTLDDKGNITFANPAVETALGYRPEELTGKNFMVLIPNEWQEKTGADFQNLLKTGEITAEAVLLDKKGRPHFVEYSSTTIKEGDKVIGTRGIIRDITERKRVEEELQESEEKCKELAESITDVFFAFDKDLRYTYWNKASEELTGISAKDALGKHLYDIFPDAEMTRSAEKVYLKVLRTQQAQSFVNEYQLGGRDYFFEISAYPSKNGLSVFVRDIAERKRMEREIQEKNGQLIRSEKLAAIGQLAGGVGHELRNPLSAIKNAVYYIKGKVASSELGQREPRVMEFLDIIDDEVNSSSKIITDLLGFSRVGKPSVSPARIEKIIEDALSHTPIPENIELTKKLDAGLPEINIDPDQIKEVVVNIITNAVEAMPEGGRLLIAAREKDKFLEVGVSDTGCGIPQESIDKIFDPLFTTKAKGIGLGLPVCKAIIDRHEGNITVESKVGEGTTFNIKLPLGRNIGGN